MIKRNKIKMAEDEIQAVVGQRGGQFVVRWDGYVFHRDWRFDEDSGRFVCAQKTTNWQCPVEQQMHDDDDDVIIRIHNHPRPLVDPI